MKILTVSILGYSEIILSDVSLYKLHGTWTHKFPCYETKNLVNCMMIMFFTVKAWLWDVASTKGKYFTREFRISFDDERHILFKIKRL